MLSGQTKAEALQSLHDNIEKFIIYNYQDEQEWRYFKIDFAEFDELTLEEKLLRLTPFLKEKSFDRQKWISLFNILIGAADSKNQLAMFLSNGIDGLNKRKKNNADAINRFAALLIEKIIELKLELKDALSLLTLSTENTNVFDVITNSFYEIPNEGANKGLWHLNKYLHDQLKKNPELAKDIYTFLNKKTDSDLSLGAVSILKSYSLEMFILLIKRLERMYSRQEVFELFSFTLIQGVLIALNGQDSKSRRHLLGYIEDLFQSESFVDYLYAQGRESDFFELFTFSDDYKLKLISALHKRATNSEESLKKIAHLLLSGQKGGMVYIGGDIFRQIVWRNVESTIILQILMERYDNGRLFDAEHVEKFFELLNKLFNQNINAKEIYSFFTRESFKKLILNNTVSLPLVQSLVSHFLQLNLNPENLLPGLMKSVKPDQFERFSLFLAWLHKQAKATESVESFLNTGFTNVGYGAKKYAFCELILKSGTPSKVLYPLIEAGLMPAGQFTSLLRDEIFAHILTLPNAEKETALRNIRDKISPLAELFWEKHDFLFIHRPATLPVKFEEKIFEELKAMQVFSAGSPRLFKHNTVTPRELSMTQFEAQFPAVPSNKDEKDNEGDVARIKFAL